MNSSDKDPLNKDENTSETRRKLLSDGRVLSALKYPFEQSSTTYFVGTDGDGINWGVGQSRGIFPLEWNVVDMNNTPALQSDHVRFMILLDASMQKSTCIT
jgi:hypothetical protein